MMTSAEIRQSFLDFFRGKQHTIVPSAPLLPEAPNLLFTNAGMNQFVPIFLGQTPCPYQPARAADTQKCIRAGGKHNDLEDVGLDTYHHTFFEMLGNWSFGDYFKREAIDWAWELLTDRWRFPKERLYATYFGGDDKIPADTDAQQLWLRHLPPDHVVPGNRRDNFWMMGETGPCGPCSEIHVDLTPRGDSRGKLVNTGTAQCMEIWNLVFIQFNAGADGALAPLPARHVDTGMGFERVAGIIHCTRGLTDFTRPISNYDSDVFTPIFGALEAVSGKRYGGSLQAPADVAFRVIADHVRCLSCAVADGIQPSNEGRGYVLRRILRRAVRAGRNLGLHEPFFYRLVDVVAASLGEVFPEVRERRERIAATLRAEEESFNRTLDRGLEIFEETVAGLRSRTFPAADAFKLYDTYGFPLDLTELMARERGLTVDAAGFETLMDEQRQRARDDHAKKKTVVSVVGERADVPPTVFLGYDHLEADAVVLSAGPEVVLDRTPFYAEMGGQVGDTGRIGEALVLDTQKQGNLVIHRTATPLAAGQRVRAAVDAARRADIQRHHTVTHLFHWALHEVVSREARQRGSLVAADRLRFDFNHPEKLSDAQLADIERLVNERIQENAAITWCEVPYAAVRGNPDVMQFFGDKYGETVRVVQIGGQPNKLDGYSMELCGGTHVRSTGDIGLFKIARESAVAAGVRRIEAAAGRYARELIEQAQADAGAEAEKARAREQERQAAKQRQAATQAQAPAIAARLVAGQTGPVIVENLGAADAELLRTVVDALKPQLTSGVVVLGGAAEGKVSLICYVTPDLVKQGKQAGRIIGAVAKLCGGGGGGRPDLAQAGGKDPAKLAAALAAVPGLI